MGLRCPGGPWAAQSLWSSQTAGDRTPCTHRNASRAESLPGREGLGSGSSRTLSWWEDRGQASDSCSPASQPARQSPWTPGLVRPRFLGEHCLGPAGPPCAGRFGDPGWIRTWEVGLWKVLEGPSCPSMRHVSSKAGVGIGDPQPTVRRRAAELSVGSERQVLGGKAQRDRQTPWMFSPGPDPRAAL